MKIKLNIAIAISFLILLGCKNKIVCGFPGIYEGKGIASKIEKLETVAMMDTVLTFIQTESIIVSQKGTELLEGKGIGVTIIVMNPEGEKVLANVSNSKGVFNTFLEPGLYDIKFMFSGCNFLVLKNLELTSGEIKKVIAKLGTQGETMKVFEEDASKR